MKTFTATIHIGLKNMLTGKEYNYDRAEKYLYSAVSTMPEGHPLGCISVTKTMFVYRTGKEAGMSIGIINYPRFPNNEEEIREQALWLANTFMHKFNQCRATVVFSDETVLLSNDGFISMVEKRRVEQ